MKSKILTPAELTEIFPLEKSSEHKITRHREEINNILKGLDERILVILGPCSIHNVDSALEYGVLLEALQQKYSDIFKFVMRVYLEKPRTCSGWKGFIHEPDVSDLTEPDIAKGLYESRKLLIRLADLNIACATEVLDPLTIPVFLGDLFSLAVIGARTTESQVHRELASGMGFPVGFKNSTDGGIMPAINGIRAAEEGHTYLSIDSTGYMTQRTTVGNPDCFLVLRGGETPNFFSHDIDTIKTILDLEGLGEKKIIVDCSHGNSQGVYDRQVVVFTNVIRQIIHGNQSVRGLMLESFLEEGRQEINPHGLTQNVNPKVSVTDGCISWKKTEKLMKHCSKELKKAREKKSMNSGLSDNLGN